MTIILSFKAASTSFKAAPVAFGAWVKTQPPAQRGTFKAEGLSPTAVRAARAVLYTIQQEKFNPCFQMAGVGFTVGSGADWVSWKAPVSEAVLFGQIIGFGLKTPEEHLTLLLRNQRVLKAFRFYQQRHPLYSSKLDYQISWRSEKVIFSTTVMPMFDWDIPDEGHLTKECITFETREGVLQHIEKMGRKVPLSLIIEHTPGGVRGWWGETLSMKHWAELSKLLKCDKLYHNMTLRQQKWNCRVSPKLVRKERDYVARFFTLVGAEPAPHIQEAYKVYRDLVSIHR